MGNAERDTREIEAVCFSLHLMLVLLVTCSHVKIQPLCQHEVDSFPRIRIAVVGAYGCGKTSLCRRLLGEDFQDA